MRIAASLVLGVTLLINASAGDRITAARAYLDKHSLFKGEIVPPQDYDTRRARILDSRDPETKFGPFIFALARHRDKYLTLAQSEKANALIEARQENPVNWHDVRNVVRMQAVHALWQYAAEPDPAEATRLKADWEAWTDLRLAYMLQEFVAQERFQRAMWNLYTPEQRDNIISGEWEHLIKKNTGHGRLFSADKQLIKALGPPTDEAAFDIVLNKWRETWEPLLQEYQTVSRFQRQREFAMDETGEDFALAAWQEYARAFRAFATTERDAIRDLLQAGYPIDAPLLKTLSTHQNTLKKQTVQKYQAHGAQFLQDLGLIK